MKKPGIVLLMTLAATGIFAQVVILPKAGASLSHLSLSDHYIFEEEEYGSKMGLVVGVAISIPVLAEGVSLQPELLLHQKGFDYKYTDQYLVDNYRYTLNYIELPILANIKFGKFHAVAGPSFAYGLGGKYRGTSTLGGQTESREGKIKFSKEPANTNPDNHYVDHAFDIGIQGGIGVQVNVLIVELRYGLGLINIYDGAANARNLRSKNGSLQLTVGFPIVRN
jgi:hypothetical protein